MPIHNWRDEFGRYHHMDVTMIRRRIERALEAERLEREDAQLAVVRDALRSASHAELLRRYQRPATMLCIGCGRRFEQRRASQVACSGACRSRVYPWRRRGQRFPPFWLTPHGQRWRHEDGTYAFERP